MRNLNAGGSIAPFLISGLILGFFEIIPDEPAMMSLADATGFSSVFHMFPQLWRQVRRRLLTRVCREVVGCFISELSSTLLLRKQIQKSPLNPLTMYYTLRILNIRNVYS
jgi:hypothetical protein